MRAIVIMFVLLCAIGGSLAAEERYDVIVHPDNPITEVDRSFVRDAYLKKVQRWGKGESIRPIDLPPKISLRDRFTQDVIRKTPSQLKNYWNQQIFSGKGVPPPEADSAREVIGYVLSHPGAIGYIPAGTDPHGAKVLKVR
ncbi:hypothetical protein BH11MYX3_BH11MYX3_47410 [soil metagenome]